MDKTQEPDIGELLCKHHRDDILTECKLDPVAAEVATLLVQIEQSQHEAGWDDENDPIVHIAHTAPDGTDLQIQPSPMMTIAHIKYAADNFDGDVSAGLHALAHATEAYRAAMGVDEKDGIPLSIPPGRKFYGVAYSCEAWSVRGEGITAMPEDEPDRTECRTLALYTRGGNFWQVTRIRDQPPILDMLRPECDTEGRDTLIPHCLSIMTRGFAGLGVPVC